MQVQDEVEDEPQELQMNLGIEGLLPGQCGIVWKLAPSYVDIRIVQPA